MVHRPGSSLCFGLDDVGRAILPAAGFPAGFFPMEDAREPGPPGKAAAAKIGCPTFLSSWGGDSPSAFEAKRVGREIAIGEGCCSPRSALRH